jgi:selenoprotein W-related protein
VELKTKFPKVDTKLISSGGGVFEITLDNNLIFSKKALERFPEEGEVEKLIRER